MSDLNKGQQPLMLVLEITPQGTRLLWSQTSLDSNSLTSSEPQFLKHKMKVMVPPS